MSASLQTEQGASGPRPVGLSADRAAYAVPRHAAPCDLRLDGNEGRAPRADLSRGLAGQWPELLRTYPDTRPLEAMLATRFEVEPGQVIVTAGADDALARLCQVMLDDSREAVLPVPTFEMIARYASAQGAVVREVPWLESSWPTEEVLDASGPRTGLVFAVTPNNPTGAVLTEDDLRRVSVAVPDALVVLDHAYAEFADRDLTRAALSLDNVVVVRTLSKAWGLAGLRIGMAIGPAPVIAWLRAAGNPYPVSGPALALAAMRLERGEPEVADFVATVAEERRRLARTLEAVGGRPLPSQANFVCARFDDAGWVRDGLAGLGIAVRAFPGRPYLEDALRITCPGGADDLWRLRTGLRAVLAPGVLVADAQASPMLREILEVQGLERIALGPEGLRPTELGVEPRPGWMLCSSPASVRAAREEGLVPLGVPSSDQPIGALLSTGAARIVNGGAELRELLA